MSYHVAAVVKLVSATTKEGEGTERGGGGEDGRNVPSGKETYEGDLVLLHE